MILKTKEVTVARNCRCGATPRLVHYRASLLDLWYVQCESCRVHSPGRLHSVQAEVQWNEGNQFEPKDSYVKS